MIGTAPPASVFMPWLALMRAGLVLAVLLASTPGYAFAPRKHHDKAAPPRTMSTGAPATARVAFAPLAQRGWRAQWSADGVPVRMWGGTVFAPGAVADPASAERAARAFLAEHVALLAPGSSVGDFVVVSNQLDGDLRTVGFAQRWRGLPVIGGQLGFVFGRDRLFAIGGGAVPNLAVATPATRASAAAMRARTEAWIETETHLRATARSTGTRAIVRHDGRDHLVDVLDVRAEDAPDRWDVYVDAGGTPIAREPRVMFATGTLEYNVGVRWAGSTRDDLPASAATIAVNATSTTTAANGSFTWAGTSPATVVPGLAGPYVEIVNLAGPLATASLNAQPNESVVWDLSTDEFGDAQLSTFVYGNLAKARARIVNPGLATWLDTPLDFYVNESGNCNAYSTGNEVHLFRASSSCENTGRLADVVFHEFGHSVHNHTVIAGMGAFESHLSEGLADFFAANLTEDPAVGRGFFLDDSPLRQIDPPGTERIYPLDFDFDPHVSGLIIAGTLWDLREDLVAALGHAAGVARTERIFTGVMARADDISTTYAAALIADDDDADLGNGTPNFCPIERAFGRHGLVVDYRTTTVEPPVVDGLQISLAVNRPTDTACPAPAVTSVSVAWKAGDGVASIFELAPDGTTWRGAFPEQPDGTVISYSVDVVFDDGTTQSLPDNPADPLYQLMVGEPVVIWCERFDTDPEWEQASNKGFEWEWGVPPANATSDPHAAHTGSGVLGTDVNGDGAYRSDLVVSVMTPVIDVSMYERVHLQYWRWLAVEDATYDRAAIYANTTQVWRNASAVNGTLDHVDKEWRFHDIEVTPYVSQGTMRVRWTLETDIGKELGGWTLDDVCLVGLVKIPRCGDGALDVGEQCDDGNTTNEDGCDDDCIDEVTAAGGGCCSAGGGPSSLLLALGVLGIGGRRRSPRKLRRAKPGL